MVIQHESYEISDEVGRIDFGVVQGWLTGTYWVPGVGREKVEQAARHSAVVVGAYAGDGRQVGYCRAISDKTRFGWVADVIVDPGHRGKGLGRPMVEFLLKHPELIEVEHWCLGTRDAHGVYERLGFGKLEFPERYMERKGRAGE